MIALQMKQKLKQVYRLSAVLHSLPSRMNADAVRTILNDFSPDSATTCVGDNVVELKYDLQIIVPAYNAEKYISECLDSVLSQETEYSYLITIVNDGSIDHTLDIINSYYSRYPDRIEVINQENKGFSGARNAGLKVLKGKYITFLDSDDVLAPRGINSLLRNTIGEVDIVQGSWFTGEKLGGGSHIVRTASELSGYPWGKAFRAELLSSFQFPEGYWFEDTPISFILYGKRIKTKLIPDVVYGYRLNPNGITATFSGKKKSIDTYYITELCLKEFPEFGVAYDERAFHYFLNQCTMNWYRTKQMPKKVREAGFVLESHLRNTYFQQFSSNEVNDKYLCEIDAALSKCNFGKFEVLVRAGR